MSGYQCENCGEIVMNDNHRCKTVNSKHLAEMFSGTSQATCALCGKPMPKGEEMFVYHGYSGPCPV